MFSAVDSVLVWYTDSFILMQGFICLSQNCFIRGDLHGVENFFFFLMQTQKKRGSNLSLPTVGLLTDFYPVLTKAIPSWVNALP